MAWMASVTASLDHGLTVTVMGAWGASEDMFLYLQRYRCCSS
jgi:hypothetical protein